MAITIPETEPLEFYAGETVKWKRTDLSDYPAPTWTLNYFLLKELEESKASSKDRHTKGHEKTKNPTKPNKQKVGFMKKHKKPKK